MLVWSRIEFLYRENILLEQKGAETTVEGAEALLLSDLGEATNKAIGEGRLGNETNTGGLKRAKGEISEELGGGGGGEVDGGAVVGSGLVAEEANGLLLEELVTTELQGTLEEVTSEGRAGTSEESASALVLDDLLEAADEAAVVGLGVELDAGLDAVMRVSVKCAHELYHRMCAMGIARRTYTSTGVRPPWVSEQQTAPAKAKRE